MLPVDEQTLSALKRVALRCDVLYCVATIDAQVRLLPFDELMLNSLSRDLPSSQDHNCSVRARTRETQTRLAAGGAHAVPWVQVMLASIANRCEGLSGRILRAPHGSPAVLCGTVQYSDVLCGTLQGSCHSLPSRMRRKSKSWKSTSSCRLCPR